MTTMVMVIFALSPPICLIFGVITLSTDLQASLTGASIDSCDCLSAVQLTVAVDLTTHVELLKGMQLLWLRFCIEIASNCNTTAF